MARGFFITGTDTGIGKTRVSLGLMVALQAKRYKVAMLLQNQASITLPYELVNPYAFEPAIAPHIAAGQQQMRMDIDYILDCYQELALQVDRVVVEGVGGWMVPINESETVAHLVHRLELPVINVVGIRLGCLNHALLTTKAIQSSGVEFKGWIANQIEPSIECAGEIIQALSERIDVPLLGINPYCPTCSADDVAKAISTEDLLT
jgi:dethiobiotin synthetase